MARLARKNFAAQMQRHENTGRPLGGESFIKKFEAMLGRALLPGKPGRPKKKLKAENQ